MKNSTALTALAVLLIIGLACGGSKTPPPSEYVGVWTGADGTSLTIRADGSGDYKSSNSSVDGGSVTIDAAAKTLKVAFAGIGPSFAIEAPPSNGKMTLSGVVYKTAPGTASSTDAKIEIPSKEKLQTLVKTTMLDFNDAVTSGDFTDFHKKTAKVWRDSTSPEELSENFRSFHDAGLDLKKPISMLDANFTPEPSIGKLAGVDALMVSGFYPTTPKKLYFDLKYALDDGTLKLIGINIKTRD